MYIACASVSFSHLYNPIGTLSHIIVICDTPVLQYTYGTALRQRRVREPIIHECRAYSIE